MVLATSPVSDFSKMLKVALRKAWSIVGSVNRMGGEQRKREGPGLWGSRGGSQLERSQRSQWAHIQRAPDRQFLDEAQPPPSGSFLLPRQPHCPVHKPVEAKLLYYLSLEAFQF